MAIEMASDLDLHVLGFDVLEDDSEFMACSNTDEDVRIFKHANITFKTSVPSLDYRIAGNFHGGLIFVIFMTTLLVTKLISTHENVVQ